MSEDVLIDGYTFLVSDASGRFGRTGGLYHRDTRYLSSLSVEIDGVDLALLDRERPVPWRRRLRYADLTSTVNEIAESADQKHTALVMDREEVVLEGAGLCEQFCVHNYARSPRTVGVLVSFDVDFADLFEVRGVTGGLSRTVESSVSDRTVTYRYDFPVGSDERTLSTGVTFGDGFDRVEPGRASVDLRLGAGESVALGLWVGPDVETGSEFPDADESRAPRSDAADSRAAGPDTAELRPLDALGSVTDALSATDSPYADTFDRCSRDLIALVTETDSGPVPLAGVPWFATQFGRDSLLTAYQTLPVWPDLARGTLRFLATHQGTTTDEFREERPGKILHELRHGELANREFVRHTPYYASIDATPLWVVLLHEAYRWLGDDDLLADLWPTAEAALDWLTGTADADPVPDDPFVYYDRPGAEGLEHGGWKDTASGVQFADGTPAEPPLAGVEVQGYAYDAYRRGAALAREMGVDSDTPEEWERRADDLRDAFEDAFWMPDGEFYAAALTADGRRVDARTSNAGHCLWSGLASPDRAAAVADGLLADDLFSGWGVRTLSADSAGYSPVSYHSGGVWPHDNSLVAHGLAQYGFHDHAERIARGVLDAGRRFGGSLPELFCGFADRPIRYPASCEPQAWSAGTPVALLRAAFGLTPGSDRCGPVAGNVPDAIPAAAVRPLFSAWRSE